MRRLGKAVLIGFAVMLIAAFMIELASNSLGTGASPSPWVSLVIVIGAVVVGAFYYRRDRARS